MEGFASSLYQNLMEKSMKRNGKAFAYLFLAVWSMTSIGCTSSSKEERAVREIPVKTWTVSLREGVYGCSEASCWLDWTRLRYKALMMRHCLL